jgi:hypothetical protein
MPFKTFNNWLFDGSRNTPLPKRKDGVDILKYNSPITHTYALSLFLRNGPLNHYLNKYFNNMGLRYLPKEELLLFLKKCVIDFRVNRRDMVYYPYRRKTKLYEALREKVPQFKNNDISLLCDIIDKLEEKEVIYHSLGIEKPKKEKLRKKKTKKKKISSEEFLKEHFSIIK